jgi:hypothetical protein
MTETPWIAVLNPISAPCILLHADPVSVMSRLHFHTAIHCRQCHNFVTVCGLLGDAVSSSVDRMRQKFWVETHSERNDRRVIQMISWVFAWRDWENPRNNSIRIVNVPAEIRTKRLPKTNLESYRYANLLVLCTNLIQCLSVFTLTKHSQQNPSVFRKWFQVFVVFTGLC